MTTTPYKTRQILPALPSGYPLDDVFSVITPAARTNLVTNPSLETDNTGWFLVGGSIARSTTQQYHGAYSLAVTPTAGTTDGAYYGTVSLILNQLYAVSAKVYGQPGVKYKISVATTGGSDLAVYRFTGSGRWQWVWVYWQETAGTTRRIYITKDSVSDTHTFYVDGLQCEAISAGETVSTYLDGDQQGLIPNQYPPPYGWNGTPHASTSYRTALTRAGGQVMRFKDYGFVLTAIIGLGLAVPENVTIDYAQLDGGQDVYTRKPTRTFSLAGRFEADSYYQLRDSRSAVTRALDRDRAALDQPLVLQHHLEDRCGNVLGDEARIVCKYQGGLGGNTQAISGEVASMQFQQVVPLVLSDRESGASLSVQQSVTAPSALLRDANGVWSSPTGWGTATIALTFAVGTNQTLYAGTSASNFFWQLNGTAWSAIGALNGSVRAFAVDANGDVYLTGDFTSPQTRIMKYVPGTGTFSAMGSGLNGVGRGLAIDPVNRKLYVVGDFTTAGGGAANRIAVWDLDGASWAAVGAGLATPGFGVVYAANRMIYALANGDSGANAVRLYSWDGSSLAVVATSGAVTDAARALVLGADNLLYGGGTFTTIGGRTVNNVFYYDYNAVQTMGTGITGSVSRLALRGRGGVTIGGNFTAAGGMTVLDGIVDWTGPNGTYLQVDADLPIGTVQALASGRDGSLYIGYNSVSSAAVTSAQTTVTNPGTARSYPTVTFKGPTSGKSRIYQLINYTTGKIIYLNYTINAGETAIFQFDPLDQRFTSDFQGNLFNVFQAGSSPSDFFLAPGANRISCFAADSTVTAIIAWRPQYGSLDDR